MFDVLTLTVNPCIDVSASVARVVPEDKLRCDAPRYDPGGGGINVARVVNVLGGRSLAVWTSGGITGDFLAKLLEAHRVENAAISVSGMTRQNVVIFEKATKLQYRFGMPGTPLSREEQLACGIAVGDRSRDYRVIVLSGSLPPETPINFYRRLIDRLPTEARVIVDTSGAALRESIGSGVFLIKPNRRELSQLTGCLIDDEASLSAAACELVRSGATQVVAASLGAEGVIVATADGARTIRCPDVPIQSKVGAGDSMVGGIATALSRGETVWNAVRYGVASGTATVMTPGTDLCRREDVERLYQSIAS
ncbi:MAG: 1-phosphofructokinase family hexose kinase [Planctomycetota bacterium]|nr:1-phosphofructokinase family hexose kinase [Planctomycetota bacterium]